MTRTPAITRTITPVVESTLTPSTSPVPDIATTNDPSVVYESCTDNIITEEFSVSDAIIKPRLVYTNGYDTGYYHSLQREVMVGGIIVTLGDSHTERAWDYISSGGENNGGYVTSIAAPVDGIQGQYSLMPLFSASNFNISFPNSVLGSVDSRVTKAGAGVRFNLFGQTLTQPMNCLAMLGSVVFARSPQVVLQILPNRTVQAVRVDNNFENGNFEIVPIGAPSTEKVPATGWFKFDWQVCISKFGNDISGFVLVTMYTLTGSAKGTQLLKHVGVKTRSSNSFDTINGWAWGTEVISGAGRGLTGIGVDDVDLYLDYGTVKKQLGNIYIDKLLPNGDGDTLQSEIVHNGTHTRAEIGASSPGPGDPVGSIITHGQTERYKNLSLLDEDLDLRQIENLDESFGLGTISSFTGHFLDTDFFDTPFVRSGVDGLIYNTLYEGQLDLYKMTNPRTDAIVIEGITPLLMVGNRTILFTVVTLGVIQWNGAARHYAINEDGTQDRDRNHVAEVIIKLDGTIRGVRSDFTHSILGNWGVLQGYTRDPWSTLIIKDDNTKFTLDDLIAIQVGARCSLDIINAAVDPSFYLQYNQFMIAQVLLEYAYLIEEPKLTEHAPFPPIAKLILYTSNLSAGNITVRDASVDWDDEIVSRVVNWRDGTPTENIVGSIPLDPADSGLWATLSHTYAESGIYAPFLSVIDASGLSAVSVINITIPHHNPVTNFSRTGVGLAITFIDSSIGVLATIVSWHWNFGDGNTSNLQNPVHTYAIAGTYPVSLTVTDNHGLTNTATLSLEVPIIINTDCTMLNNTIVNQPFVQGDTFDGRNLPFTQYVNTAAFDVFYYGDTFRSWYDTSYDPIGDANSHIIDTTVKFNNHPTLKMEFGGIYRGAGWFSTLTDDGDPTEHYYNTIPYGSTDQWFGLILKAEAGIATDPALHDNSYFNGLELFSFGDSVFFFIGIRNGSVFIDIQSRITDGGSLTTVSFKLCDESELIGTTGFRQLCALYQSDNVAHTSHIAVWFGDACTLAGQSPNFAHDIVAYMSGGTGGSGFSYDRGLASDSLSFFNYVYSTPATPKSLWLAEAVSLPFSVSGNPFGVSLT